MKPPHKAAIEKLVIDLQERTKELNCLYSIEDSLNRSNINIRTAFHTVINAISPGFQFPEICKAKLEYGDKIYQTSDFEETSWFLSEYIVVQEKLVGELKVFYTKEMPPEDIGPFLNEEKKLLKTIADRLGHFILHQKLKNYFVEFKNVGSSNSGEHCGEWRIVMDMLRRTDPMLFMTLLRKLLHTLCWKGVEEADFLLKNSSIAQRNDKLDQIDDDNRPLEVKKINNYDEYIESILNLANENLGNDEILIKIQKWITEDKSANLVKIVENQESSLTDIGDAIRRFYHIAPEKLELSPSVIKGLRVSILRRFFSDHLDYLKIAKEYVRLTDFYFLMDKMIYPSSSHGQLGGKSAGLFLAYHIVQRSIEEFDNLQNIKSPNTWYISSDTVMHFIRHNNLEEVLEQKYKEIGQVRLEYPQIVQLFKNSHFPNDIVKGLSVALDDLGTNPLVVRSSGLLEDQMGAAFSGKYKSLFLANQGSKSENLAALQDAIAEVYASMFGPDPIEYRSERELLDFHEEMGIMIQEVVGNKVGCYYLPSYAGVAFSNNEFRWSPRIKREDGLVRLVPGLGTRAVDRLADDYPILVSPGQPNLRVNISLEETIRYSPQKVDVINLETNSFETKKINELLHEFGDEYPGLNNILSQIDGTMLRQPVGLNFDFQRHEYAVSFSGLLNNSKFLKKMDTILKVLQLRMGTPVDIEFAADGEDFYLLQCRPQSYTHEIAADHIPIDVPKERVIFSANRYISNGKVPEITHIVYVDPLHYSELPDRERMLQVGKAVGKLNKMLPKRKFILMGPGRWGSRGDIKLGVNVTYSQINNTAVLIEIAKKKGNYVPDLSFGTHFFQDLVESSIRYLPLYPDDNGIIFQEEFFTQFKNHFTELLPNYSHLSNTIKVIDIPQSTDGSILKILVNADLQEAVGILSSPSTELEKSKTTYEAVDSQIQNHWGWRYKMAEKIASVIDLAHFGIKGIYIFGSTKNATAGPGSDIDLIVHISSLGNNRESLDLWFDGWSKCLAEMNYLRCGYKTDGILDIHYVTDEDIEKKTSYAAKIGAVTNAAKPLKLLD